MKKVSDVMSTEVITIYNSATIMEATKLLKEKKVNALIVEKSHELDAYGIISVKDIVGKVIAFGRNPKNMRVYEVMTKPCIVVNPDLDVEYAAQLLSQANLHSAPVIKGSLIGVISMTDILERSSAVEQSQEVGMLDEVQRLSDVARRICEDSGSDSTECVQAWAAADALRIEFARQQAEVISTPFELYQESHLNLSDGVTNVEVAEYSS